VWEHSFGITIETIDNPGWSVTISLERTELESIPFEPVKTEANERDWFQCRVAERGDGENQRRFKYNSPRSRMVFSNAPRAQICSNIFHDPIASWNTLHTLVMSHA
jgi:Immunity protein 53